jgi:hypothetical protein
MFHLVSASVTAGQVQHEKEVLQTRYTTQMADSEAEMMDVLRVSREKDETIRALKEEQVDVHTWPSSGSC